MYRSFSLCLILRPLSSVISTVPSWSCRVQCYIPQANPAPSAIDYTTKEQTNSPWLGEETCDTLLLYTLDILLHTCAAWRSNTRRGRFRLGSGWTAVLLFVAKPSPARAAAAVAAPASAAAAADDALAAVVVGVVVILATVVVSSSVLVVVGCG